MCYRVKITSSVEELEKRFEATYAAPEPLTQYYHANGFAYPKIPVMALDEPNKIKLFNWGLIPAWTKELSKKNDIRRSTLNARSETIFELPSFRSVKKKRCLVLVNGFYEFRDFNDAKYPYYIHLPNDEPFALGGIYENWTDKETGDEYNTFSIVTVDANPLMAKIHNSAKRMPLILPKETERLWLEPNVDEVFLKDLFKQYPAEGMQAHSVSRLITSRKENSNVPKVSEEEVYAELPGLD